MGMKVEDTLFIGYDYTNGKDVTVLTVAKRVGTKMTLINAFDGKEAEELYLKLTTLNKKLK